MRSGIPYSQEPDSAGVQQSSGGVVPPAEPCFSFLRSTEKKNRKENILSIKKVQPGLSIVIQR